MKKQRVPMFVRVEKELKTRLEIETKRQKTSLARLIDAILRQYLEEDKDGQDTITARKT